MRDGMDIDVKHRMEGLPAIIMGNINGVYVNVILDGQEKHVNMMLENIAIIMVLLLLVHMLGMLRNVLVMKVGMVKTAKRKR